MSRRPFIAGNWKLHHGPTAAGTLARQLASSLGSVQGVTLAVFPSALAVASVVAELRGSTLAVGVQDIARHATGAYTGANSAVFAREAGCEYCLVGHSERRQLWGETNAGCAQKLPVALEAGLLPILCVGETLEERRAGTAEAVVRTQLEEGLAQLKTDQVGALTLAYEPVWAIGTGETATPEQAQAMHYFIRSWLRDRHAPVADDVRVLYGGSVKPGNAAELLAQVDIDGALVGGASLDAGSFATIVGAARS